MLTLLEAPIDSTLTLSAVKSYLNIDDEDHDETLYAFIDAATSRLDGRDGILGRCLRPQRWRYGCSRFPLRAKELRVPLPPTIGVDAVTYLDASGARIPYTDYRVIEGGWNGAAIVPNIGELWPPTYAGVSEFSYDLEPQLDTVQIDFRAGYQDLSSPVNEAIPASLLVAMMMMIGDWYENRVNTIVGTTAQAMPIAVEMLIAPYRLIPVA